MTDLNQGRLKIKAGNFLRHLKKPLSRVIEIILLIAFTLVAYIFILYFAKYLWIIFTATDVGQKYAEIYEESFRITNDVLGRDIIGLAIKLTLTSCVICFIFGAIFKFLHIIRYLFFDRGFFLRIIFVGLPLTYVVAAYLYYTGDFSHMDTAFTVAVVPTLCMFAGCFRFAEELLPEFAAVIFIFRGQLNKIVNNQNDEEAQNRADALSNKEDRKQNNKQSGTGWHIILQDIWESFKAYVTVILITVSVAGILFVIPQIRSFTGIEAPRQAAVPAVEATEQIPEPLKNKIDTDERFIASSDKIVLDTKTRLMWVAEESETLSWYDAKRYCKNYRGGGYKDWRMPTISELEGLYDSSRQPDCGCVTNLIEMYNGANCWEWSSESKGSEAAFFAFNLNGKQWLPKLNESSVHIRPVRTCKE